MAHLRVYSFILGCDEAFNTHSMVIYHLMEFPYHFYVVQISGRWPNFEFNMINDCAIFHCMLVEDGTPIWVRWHNAANDKILCVMGSRLVI